MWRVHNDPDPWWARIAINRCRRQKFAPKIPEKLVVVRFKHGVALNSMAPH